MQAKTNNEITEGNILIAEFLGYKKVSSDKDFTFYEHPDKKGVITQADYDCKKFITHGLMESRGFIFHRSYDWLMPVVEKIETISDGLFDIERWNVKISWWYHKDLKRMGIDRKSQWYSSGGIFHQHVISHYPESKEKLKESSKLKATWLACVIFINWYNENV